MLYLSKFKVTARDFVLGILTLQSARTVSIEDSWQAMIVVNVFVEVLHQIMDAVVTPVYQHCS